MIKKITQNVTKLIWRNSLFAFALLLSMTANSQEVGGEYLAKPWY